MACGTLHCPAYNYTNFFRELVTWGFNFNYLGHAQGTMGCFLLVLFPQLLLHKFQLKKEHRKQISILSKQSDGSNILGPQRSLQIPGKEAQKSSISNFVQPRGYRDCGTRSEQVRNNVSIFFFHFFVTIRYLTRSKSYYGFFSSSLLL